jgi:uncharacterized protein
MLKLKPGCECCDVDLPPESAAARICSFECTFCDDCARHRLAGVCPNCGGELVPRPRRPAARLDRFPASTERVFKPQGFGVPFVVKDNIDVAGAPTTAACPAFATRPAASATVVQQAARCWCGAGWPRPTSTSSPPAWWARVRPTARPSTWSAAARQRRLERRLGGGWWGAARCRWRWAPIPPARAASLPASTTLSASSPRRDASAPGVAAGLPQRGLRVDLRAHRRRRRARAGRHRRRRRGRPLQPRRRRPGDAAAS